MSVFRWCRSHPRAAVVLAGGCVALAGMTMRSAGRAGRQLGYSSPGAVLLAFAGIGAVGLYALLRWQAGEDDQGEDVDGPEI